MMGKNNKHRSEKGGSEYVSPAGRWMSHRAAEEYMNRRYGNGEKKPGLLARLFGKGEK